MCSHNAWLIFSIYKNEKKNPKPHNRMMMLTTMTGYVWSLSELCCIKITELEVRNLGFSPGFTTNWLCHIEQVALPLSTMGLSGCFRLHLALC